MQISNKSNKYLTYRLLLAAMAACFVFFTQYLSAHAMELEEKLPAIAPPSAPFKEQKGSSDPAYILPKRFLPQNNTSNNVQVTPIAPPKPVSELTPTLAYNKGALAYHQKDFAAALTYWVRASELGVMGASWRVAHMYRLGHGTAVDHVKAFRYFQQVAEKHKYNVRRNKYTPLTIDALVWVGTYYRKGLPDLKIKPDTEKAIKIFRYAASHGQHPVAQYHLGDMYVTGNGVNANGPRGMRWHNLAAKKNYAPSQAALGELYWQGKAVDPNKSRAMMYFFLAIQSGRPSEKDKFRERLTMLKSTATQPEIDHAQLLVNEWIARSQRNKNK